MAEHTPGPWTAARHHGVYDIIDPHGTLAIVGSNEANALLIAAAPTMFEYIERKASAGDPEAQSIVEGIRGNS